VQEIKESEKKLKIISIRHVVSASRGEIPLRNLIEQTGEESAINNFAIDNIVQELMTGL